MVTNIYEYFYVNYIIEILSLSIDGNAQFRKFLGDRKGRPYAKQRRKLNPIKAWADDIRPYDGCICGHKAKQ